MLVKKDYKDKMKTKYICDMCKMSIHTDTRYVISVANPKGISKKKWDLCSKCHRIVEKNVEIWSDRKRGTYD